MSPIPSVQKRRLVEKLGKLYGFCCHYCGTALNAPSKTHSWEMSYGRDWKAGIEYVIIDGKYIEMRRATVDHIIPQSQGGDNSLENLVLCCMTCNVNKRDKPYKEFVQNDR